MVALAWWHGQLPSSTSQVILPYDQGWEPLPGSCCTYLLWQGGHAFPTCRPPLGPATFLTSSLPHLSPTGTPSKPPAGKRAAEFSREQLPGSLRDSTYHVTL